MQLICNNNQFVLRIGIRNTSGSRRSMSPQVLQDSISDVALSPCISSINAKYTMTELFVVLSNVYLSIITFSYSYVREYVLKLRHHCTHSDFSLMRQRLSLIK